MSSGAALAQAPAKKPNVVVIMADGVGWSDFGVYRGGMRLGRGEGMSRHRCLLAV
jgi:arylsulfatase A-like enzyme